MEMILFSILWTSSKSTIAKGIDRLKRSILKNNITEGGLNTADVEYLKESLKLR
jgi:hypothetical protein